MKRAVFWVAVALVMEAAMTSEMYVNFYQTTWCYNPEDSHLINCSVVKGPNIAIRHVNTNILICYNVALL
jgi:hypothetical protein